MWHSASGKVNRKRAYLIDTRAFATCIVAEQLREKLRGAYTSLQNQIGQASLT